MIKIIVDYLLALMDYNYRKFYWNAVYESQFSAINVAMAFLENQDKTPKPKKPNLKIKRNLDTGYGDLIWSN